MNEVTRLLNQIEDGNASAADQLLPLVYDELRRLAAARVRHELPGQTLPATALVHEACLQPVGNDNGQSRDNKGQFFASAAKAMRRILLNRARDKKRLKRGGDRFPLDLSKVTVAIETPDEVLIELDEAIERLKELEPETARLVQLRFFAGLSMQDASASLGLTRRQGDRLWAFARAWLFDYLRRK